jgi:hypothetical protein
MTGHSSGPAIPVAANLLMEPTVVMACPKILITDAADPPTAVRKAQ